MNHNAWHGKVALVVEDSALQRGVLAEMVLRLGFGTVLEAGDGNEALRMLDARADEPVFLVVTDLEMPGMDGIELTHHLATRPLARHLIVVSSRDPRLLEIVESMGSEHAAIGLLGTVPKPVRESDMLRLLQLTALPVRGHSAAFPGLPPTLDDLAAALARNEFVLHYQPKVAIRTGFIKGVEALARWQHPQHGLLSPGHFIPELEGTPLMAPFTLALVEQVLRQIPLWQAGGLPGITVSVNLSAANLAEGKFVEQLTALVNAHGIAPETLIWEVTETMVMQNLSQSLVNLGRLRLAGFGLAMDDYGIGYSSLQQLSRCPFTELKIDRAFVDGAAQRSNRFAVLASAIDLGVRLGLISVAEGVETEEDWHLLSSLGCDMAQGYLLARPMAPEELVGWFRSNRARLRQLVRKHVQV
jgi:EAL domain-containing protein (putative c-di-GMP-specific phosphodiesterase class I)/AmiR/NasT family two-component response regulator